MNQPEVITKLQAVFDDIFIEPVQVTRELTAKDVEEWDSLLHIALMLAIERAFGVRFRVGEVGEAKNVGDLIDLILRRIVAR